MMTYGRITFEEMSREPHVHTAPHRFEQRGWRWWICRHCYLPRILHPTQRWEPARPLGDNRHLSFRRWARQQEKEWLARYTDHIRPRERSS